MNKADILVVDDYPINQEYIQFLCEDHGFSFHACADAADTKALIQGTEFKVTFLDQNMPNQTGSDLLHELADNGQLSRLGRVVIITADVYFNGKVLKIDQYIDSVLTKPIDADDLEAVLLKLVADDA